MDYSLLLIFFKKSRWADEEELYPHMNPIRAQEPSLMKSRDMAFSRADEEDVILEEENEGECEQDQDVGPQKSLSEQHKKEETKPLSE